MIYNIEEELNKYELAKNDFSKVPANKWEHTEVLTDLNGKPYTVGIKDGISWKLQSDEEEMPVVASAPNITEIEKQNQIALKQDINTPNVEEGPLPGIVGDTTKAFTRAAATVGENTTSLVANVLGAPGDLANYIVKTWRKGMPMADDTDFNENFDFFIGGEDINNTFQNALSWIDTNLMGNNPIDTWAAEPYNNETFGNLTEGLAQFIIPAVPTAKLVKAGDIIVNGMVSLSPMVRGYMWGAIADTLAFPANEELITKRLAEYFVGKTPEERTEFANQVMGIFEKNPEHAEIFNTLKNTSEGLIIGGFADGILRSIPFLRTAIRAAKGINWKELYDRIEFDPNTLSSGGLGGIRFRGAGDNNPPGPIISNEPFYSVVEETVNNLPMEKGSGQQIFNTIKNSTGVKPEELKWLGLETFLKDKKTVTKQEVLEHINANRLQVDEVDYTYDGPVGYDDIDMTLTPIEDQAFISEEISFLYDNIFDQDISDFPETLKEMLEANLISKADEVYLLDMFNKNGTEAIFENNPQTKNFVDMFENLVQEKATAQYNDFPYYEWNDNNSGYRIIGNEDVGFIAFNDNGDYIKLTDEFNLNSTIDEVKMDMADSGYLDYEGKKPKHTKYQFGDEGIDFENPREFVIHGPDLEGNTFVQDAHYPEENPFFHYRTNDRITKDGKKTLFVEEIQSDLHQTARDRGYADQNKIAKAYIAKVQAQKAWQEVYIKESAWLDKNLLMRTPTGSLPPFVPRTGTIMSDANKIKLHKEFNKFIKEKEDLKIINKKARDALYEAQQGVIDAPLKTSWHETAFRRIVRRAAEEGYDSVTWTPGSMQSARYSGRAPEGMSGFYDKMIKNYAEKWGKKYGAKVSVTNITRSGEPVEVWEFTISPELKETVLEKGVPFYGIPAAVGAEQMINQETQDNTI